MAMEQEKKKKGLRIVIVLLAVLLGLSLAALAGVFIYSRLARRHTGHRHRAG